MNKILEHLKNNAAIYLIVIVCIIIGVLIFQNHDNEKIEYDTRPFNIVDNKKALELFESNEPQMLVIGKKTCSASKELLPSLVIAQTTGKYKTNYLELTDLKKGSEDYNKLLELLDYEYQKDGETKPFREYMGATPMVIVIKDNKMVYGYLGLMNNTVVSTIAKQYGVSNE